MSEKVEMLAGDTPPIFQNMQLDTLQGAKDFYARVIETYSQGGITSAEARTLTYLMANYLSYLKAEREMWLEDEIMKLWEVVDERRKDGN